jgi:hypothetical protein
MDRDEDRVADPAVRANLHQVRDQDHHKANHRKDCFLPNDP